ncbi:unnamed protein product [Ectocarpus sp. CCAP 1310/34]|nr:unnamed protein product [Ectocarpus sp. CCAP 1310/34]
MTRSGTYGAECITLFPIQRGGSSKVRRGGRSRGRGRARAVAKVGLRGLVNELLVLETERFARLWATSEPGESCPHRCVGVGGWCCVLTDH